MSGQPSIKIFGVAIDASDDPNSLQLKHAAMHAKQRGVTGLVVDPYDAIIPQLKDFTSSFEEAGKLPIPSWLTPMPEPKDAWQVTLENLRSYVAKGGLLEQSKRIRVFIEDEVFPCNPIMLGIDHSATGGVVSALSEKLSPESLTVLVLDQHFDGLPLSLRLEPKLSERFGSQQHCMSKSSDIADDDAYCCGNFWKHLIDIGSVLPRNLVLVGVADYPGDETPTAWNTFKKNYLEFENRGCRFFPLHDFTGDYPYKLQRFIEEAITTPYLYISLDLDVGAYESVYAARFMDRAGLNKRTLMTIATLVSDYCRSGRTRLVGLDVMEFNMHFLGLKVAPGLMDNTQVVALDFIKKILWR